MNFKDFKTWFYNYKWMEFILSSVFTVIIAIIAYNHDLNWLGPFAAIGLITIGYISENKLVSIIMGGIGALPIAIAINLKILGPITININYYEFILLVYVIVFIMGGVVGFIGNLVYNNRLKVIKEKNSIGKKKKKKSK